MIHVIYRHTDNPSGSGKNRPSWFSYEKSLENFLRSVEGDDFCRVHMLNDGLTVRTDNRFYRSLAFSGGSDWESYKFSWKYAKSLDLSETDLIYFAENDYVFVKGWCQKVRELYESYTGIQYVSLYDHPHFYNGVDYPNLTTYLLPTATHHWRTLPSSTGSVIVSKKVLDEDFGIHVTNPSDRGRFEFLAANRGRYVLAPIPSLSTHCEVEWLAPVRDWKTLIES